MANIVRERLLGRIRYDGLRCGCMCVIINDELVYNTIRKRDRKHLLFQGEEMAEYDAISDLEMADGKLLCSVRSGFDRFVLWGSWRSPAYLAVHFLRFKEGAPFYVACSAYGSWQLIWGDWRGLVHTMGSANFLSSVFRFLDIVDGRPLYEVHDGRKVAIVWGHQQGPWYDGVSSVTIVDGKPFYGAMRRMPTPPPGTGESFYVWGSDEGESYKGASYNPTSVHVIDIVQGKPLYSVGFIGGFLVWGDYKTETYDYISFYAVINNRLLYFVKRDHKSWMVSGDLHGKTYDRITEFGDPRIIDGKPVFIGRVRKPRCKDLLIDCLVWGDEESPYYDHLLPIGNEGGKPLCIARRKKQYFFLWGFDEMRSYDEIQFNYLNDVIPHLVEGDLFYAARRGENWFAVHGNREMPLLARPEVLRLVNGRPFYTFKQQKVWHVAWGESKLFECDGFVDWEFKIRDAVLSCYIRRGRDILEVSIRLG